MKKSEIKAALLDLNVPAETINSIATPLTQIIGDSNAKLLERKQEEFKGSQPKVEDLLKAKIKEYGFDSFDAIKKLQTENTDYKTKFEGIAKAEKQSKFNTSFDGTMKDLQIEDKYKPLVKKFINQDDIFTEEGEVDAKGLMAKAKEVIDTNFKDIITPVINKQRKDPQGGGQGKIKEIKRTW